MKAGPSHGRLRRPARGRVLAEFTIGIIAGILASFFMTFAFDVYSRPNSSSILTQSDQTPSKGISQDTTGSPAKPVARDINWIPRERLPGFVDPKIACIVTQQQLQDFIPEVVNATWGSRCDRLIFASPRSSMDLEKLRRFETVDVENSSALNMKWTAFRALILNLLSGDSHYFLFVDDKTYAIPDNVRYEFRGLSPGADSLFWGRLSGNKVPFLSGTPQCMTEFFVFSRKTLEDLRVTLKSESRDECKDSSEELAPALSRCLAAMGTPCKPALDFQGKEQIMDDPVHLLSKSELPAHMLKGSNCCSVLPLAFVNVARTVQIKTGIFSFHYFYDYFVRDTGVFGREYMRPLNGIDAGVGKAQIGF